MPRAFGWKKHTVILSKRPRLTRCPKCGATAEMDLAWEPIPCLSPDLCRYTCQGFMKPGEPRHTFYQSVRNGKLKRAAWRSNLTG